MTEGNHDKRIWEDLLTIMYDVPERSLWRDLPCLVPLPQSIRVEETFIDPHVAPVDLEDFLAAGCCIGRTDAPGQ